MDIETMRTFVILSETLNFTRTSETMFVSQSTISNRINELEKELGIRLLQRNNRSVRLTERGLMFLQYAKQVIAVTDESLPGIRSGKVSAVLRIGCSNTIYECHLGRELKESMADDTSYKITIGLSADLNEKIQKGLFDVVYTFIPFRKAGFDCRPYHTDRMVLVTDFDNRSIKAMSRDELACSDFVMCDFALSEVGNFIRNLFPRHHRFPIEIDDCSKVAELLTGTSYYAFLPEQVAEPYISGKVLREVGLKDIDTPVIASYVIKRR